MMTAANGMTVLCLLPLLLFLQGCSSNILNDCKIKCQVEEDLKRQCTFERNCQTMLPDLQAFIQCTEPCQRLGNNCFQRCAFDADKIEENCKIQCGLDGPLDAVLVPGQIGRVGGGARGSGRNSGSQCYKRCYDNQLNNKMDRLFRKRPL